MATDSWWTSEGASLFALVRRFSTSNLEICSQSRADLGPSQSTRLLGTRRPPRRLAFNASSLRQARTSSYDLHTRPVAAPCRARRTESALNLNRHKHPLPLIDKSRPSGTSGCSHIRSRQMSRAVSLGRVGIE